MDKKKDQNSERYKGRSNLWAFLIYPGDSAPDNYLSILENLRIPVAISPEHDPDPDVDPDQEGDAVRKKHRHVMIYFGIGSNKSFDQVSALIEPLHGTRPFVLHNMKGYARYLIHYDNPEKQQSGPDGKKWTEDSIIKLSGFEMGDVFGSFVEDEKYYAYIEDLIISNKIVDLASLILLLKETNCSSEVSFVRRHTYYIDRYLDGNYRRQKKQIEEKKKNN